ncbi:MAG: MBL fold metallo-hydrolase [Ruminococcus sp.]|jgi:glyoxylase-like metal-dependent hydrolase (beta-lactamase superfamily II)|nr:MBL fold metallo-hydrolase [Ruminococcus sp.]
MEVNVSMIPAARDGECNAYLIERNGEFVLIDAPEQAIDVVKKITNTGKKLTALILTHGHFDHIFGLKAIEKVSGAKVYMHEAETSMLRDTSMNLAGLAYLPGTFPVYTGPVAALHDGDSLTIGDITYQIFHAPGHTPGCICIVMGSMIFTGDFLFKSSIGNTSFPNSKPQIMEKSLQRFLEKFGNSDYTLCPGHGEKTSMERELKYNQFLQ